MDAVVTTEPLCPESHPEDLIFEMWPGSRGYLSCFQDESDRRYELRYKPGEYDVTKNRDDRFIDDNGHCTVRHGKAPIFQNRFNGLRYCGKRGELNFLEA